MYRGIVIYFYLHFIEGKNIIFIACSQRQYYQVIYKCTKTLISQFSLNIFVPISAHELDFSNVCITSRCKMRKIILSLFAQSTTFSYKAFIIIIQIYTECVSTILTINQSLSNRASQMEGNNVFPIKRSLTNSLVFV